MNEIIIWFIAAIAGVFFLFALFVLITGLRQPVEHTITRRIQLTQSAEELWNTISDHQKKPEWQPHLEWIKRLPDDDGQEVWRLKIKGPGNPVTTLQTIIQEPPHRLVQVLHDEKKVFDGRWEITLKPIHAATEVILTETAAINNPAFRGLYHLFGNKPMYLDLYLNALAAKYQESVTITD